MALAAAAAGVVPSQYRYCPVLILLNAFSVQQQARRGKLLLPATAVASYVAARVVHECSLQHAHCATSTGAHSLGVSCVTLLSGLLRVLRCCWYAAAQA